MQKVPFQRFQPIKTSLYNPSFLLYEFFLFISAQIIQRKADKEQYMYIANVIVRKMIVIEIILNINRFQQIKIYMHHSMIKVIIKNQNLLIQYRKPYYPFSFSRESTKGGRLLLIKDFIFWWNIMSNPFIFYPSCYCTTYISIYLSTYLQIQPDHTRQIEQYCHG